MNAEKYARKIKVTINGEDYFEAWSFGEDWNGWAMPYFEKNVADKVAAVHNCKFKQEKDLYEFEQDGVTEKYESLTIDTDEGPKKVYAIGAGSWIWDTKDDDEKVEDANGNEIKEGDVLIATEDIEFGFTDGGRVPKVIYKKGEVVVAGDVFWDEQSLSGKVVVQQYEFESYLFVKEARSPK